MRLYALLSVFLLALHAQSATINGPATKNIEKLLEEVPKEPIKDVPVENVSNEDVDSLNTIKDVENNLRVKPVDSIPVQVIIEEPVIEDASNDVKRVEIDLKNPGEPQRQEHDTQSPEHFDHEQQVVSTIKQALIDSDATLKQGFQGVAQNIQEWIQNNEQLGAIVQSISGLQQSFQDQISKLNSTLQSYVQNQFGGTVPINQKQKPEIVAVEQNLNELDNNFKIGVKALSEGVQVFAALREETDKPNPSPNPQVPTPSSPNNIFAQYLQLFQNTISQGFSNVTSAIQGWSQGSNVNNAGTTGGGGGGFLQGWNAGIQSILNPGGSAPPAGVQSDDPTTLKPTIWQGIQSSIQTILNPGQVQNGQQGQNQASTTPNRPIAQAIQNIPFVQGVVSLIQPNKPAAQPTGDKPAEPAQEGSNAVPVEPSEIKPESADTPAKTEQQAVVNNNEPIKDIIQNNPIVKGISSAVQRLQSSIKPDQPRDAVAEQVNEEVKEEVKETTEPKGHGGGGSGSVSDNSGVALKTETEKIVDTPQPIAEEPIKKVSEKEVETKKTEQS